MRGFTNQKLFSYVSGGIKSPFFMTNNIYKKQTKKINLEFINLATIYKKEEDFSDDEIKFFINENKDQLKEEHLDFSYIKISPQNLIGSKEFNELFFKKIDELENNILNDVPFNNLIKEIKIQPKKGLTLIWPSEWTHLHKGSITNETKYIITGWLHFPDDIEGV